MYSMTGFGFKFTACEATLLAKASATTAMIPKHLAIEVTSQADSAGRIRIWRFRVDRRESVNTNGNKDESKLLLCF